MPLYADMVKLLNTIDLGSIAERLLGRTPSIRTTRTSRAPPVIKKNIETEFPTVEGFRRLIDMQK